jgi:hypothetical protein
MGISSWVAEQLVLNAIEREMASQVITKHAEIELALIPLKEAVFRSQALQKVFHLTALSEALSKHQLKTAKSILRKQGLNNQDTSKMATAFKVLKSTDFMEKMRSIMREN